MIPNPLSPAQLLHELKQRIMTEIKDAWLFPQRRVVSGFMGTGPIVIVGWRPSWSLFEDDGANRQFYEILTDHGLENAHLTNIVKSRGRKGESDPLDFALHEEIFWRELEIISASFAVVPMGDAYDRVAELLISRGVKPLAHLPQYASMNYGPDRVAAFRNAVSQVATVAQRHRWIL